MAREKAVPKSKDTRRCYTDEFTSEAVRMRLVGHTARSVMHGLGLPNVSMFYRWKQERLTQGGPVASAHEARVREMESELRCVSCDVVKKRWLFSASANNQCLCGH